MASVQTIGKGPITGLPLITKEEAIKQGCTNIKGAAAPAAPVVATVQGNVAVASQDPIADVLELHYRKKKPKLKMEIWELAVVLEAGGVIAKICGEWYEVEP
jgi:hypothetical protein